MVVAGAEIAADTTSDAGALGIAQSVCSFPVEVLIAAWGDPQAYRLPLAQAVWWVLDASGMRVKPRDRIASKRAVLYAVDRFSGVEVYPLTQAAKRAGMRSEAFLALAKLAEGILSEWVSEAQRFWISARFGNGNAISRAKVIMVDEGERKAASRPLSGGCGTPATALEQPGDLGSDAKQRARLATRRKPPILHATSPEWRRRNVVGKLPYEGK